MTAKEKIMRDALERQLKYARSASFTNVQLLETALEKIDAMPDENCVDCAEKTEALRKIYEYRSDKPDWNIVMAIAGDIVDPQICVGSGAKK